MAVAATARAAEPAQPVTVSSCAPAGTVSKPVTPVKRRSRSTGTIHFSTAAIFTPVPCPCVSTEPITAAPAPPLDAVQKTISEVFVAPIAWVDSFFFTEHQEIETNDSYMRLILGTDWTNGSGFKARRAVRFKLRVPGLQNRLRILFTQDEERDLDQSAAPGQGGTLTRRPLSPATNDDRQRAGLGYKLLDTLNSTRIDVETALRSHARAELNVRLRQKIPVSQKTKGSFSVSGFWLQKTGFGSRGRLDFERPLNKNTMFREENSVTQIHAVNGVVEDSRISLETQLNARAGISPGVGFSGSTRPVWRMEAVNASVLYRQNFFREWLFYELEPGVNWSRNEFGAHPPIMTGAIRLEVQFRRGG